MPITRWPVAALLDGYQHRRPAARQGLGRRADAVVGVGDQRHAPVQVVRKLVHAKSLRARVCSLQRSLCWLVNLRSAMP